MPLQANALADRGPAPSPTDPAGRAGPARSYGSYVCGRDIPSDRWVYTVSSRSLLEDVFTSVSLKRALEADPHGPAVEHPYVVGRCAVADDAAVDEAILAAAQAAQGWARTDLAHRMLLGPMFRRSLHDHRDALLDLLVAEAHPLRLARWELTCLEQVFSDESCSWYAQMMHAEFTAGGRRLLVRRQPDGVVCVNPPQNAPAPSAALSVLALMAGNAVVVRAPRSIALSTMFILRELVGPLLDELGAPAGTVNALCGNPRRMIQRWLENPLVNDIFYFGSSEEGLRFELDCVARSKKPILELAGNDGLVVWADADLELAAEAVSECFYGSGQICMVPNYVVVHPAVAEELLDRVRAAVRDVRPGYPDDEGVLLSPVRRSERFFGLLADSLAGGAVLVCGGHRTELDGARSDTGVFLEPTVVRVDGLAGARELDVVAKETFFPLLPVVVAEPAPEPVLLERVIDFVDSNDYGLRNSLWTRSPEVIDAFVGGVRNGGLLKVNDSHIGFLPYLPSHGGTGLTGGAFGEANYPMVRTSHLQGVSISPGTSPRAAVFGD